MRTHRSYIRLAGVLSLVLAILSLCFAVIPQVHAATLAVSDIVVLPRNYNFTWGTSGENIANRYTVYCSANPDKTRVIYWRTTDGDGNAGVNDWNPNVQVAGNYNIYVWLPDYTHDASITQQAKYYLDGNLLATIDQNNNKCSWVWLGQRYFNAGTGQTISMPARTSEPSFRLIAGDGLLMSYVNTVPVAYAQSVSTAEDTPLGINLTASDADGNPLSYGIVSPPAHGNLTGAVPNLTYTPASNYNGSDSFTFKVNDTMADSNTATISINVTAVNDSPVAYAQSVSTAEDTPLGITLTASDVDGGSLSYGIVSAPAHGNLTGAAPSLTYTPAANYNGPDSFTFKVNDTQADSNTATVTINVTAVNDPPIANAQSVSTAEDTPLGITLTASDVEGGSLSYGIVSPPAHGNLTGTAPNLTYTPAANYNGPDSFTFKANDTQADSNTATVSINVTAVNDSPVANPQSVTTAESTAIGITLTASDVDGDPLTFAMVSSPAHGNLTGTIPNLTYTPAANYNGPDSFTFKASDSLLDSNTATVSINVTEVNDPPVANAQSVSVLQDNQLGITLTATDPEDSTLTYSIVNDPAHGALSGAAPSLTYTPGLGYSGPDSFTFRAYDGASYSNTATVTITVTPNVVIGIEPLTNTVIKGYTFSVSIKVRSGIKPVDNVQVNLNFDPSRLQIMQVIPNTTALPITLKNQYSNTDGTFDYAASAFSDYPEGTFTLLVIQFKAIGVTTGTPLEFQFDAPRNTDVTYAGGSILNNHTNASIVVTDAPVYTCILPLILVDY
jgi:hypothetical protein